MVSAEPCDYELETNSLLKIPLGTPIATYNAKGEAVWTIMENDMNNLQISISHKK